VLDERRLDTSILLGALINPTDARAQLITAWREQRRATKSEEVAGSGGGRTAAGAPRVMVEVLLREPGLPSGTPDT
jgi:hypothetical protein